MFLILGLHHCSIVHMLYLHLSSNGLLGSVVFSFLVFYLACLTSCALDTCLLTILCVKATLPLYLFCMLYVFIVNCTHLSQCYDAKNKDIQH